MAVTVSPPMVISPTLLGNRTHVVQAAMCPIPWDEQWPLWNQSRLPHRSQPVTGLQVGTCTSDPADIEEVLSFLMQRQRQGQRFLTPYPPFLFLCRNMLPGAEAVILQLWGDKPMKKPIYWGWQCGQMKRIWIFWWYITESLDLSSNVYIHTS